MLLNEKMIELSKINKVHFVGIGGIGMSALAFALLSKGKKVSGTDKKASNITDKLTEMGAKVNIEHSSDNITSDIDIIVVSTAIDKTNPEIIKAKELNIPIYHRADLLNAFLRSHESIAVTGTHGKTSTSAMMSQVLYEANLQPTALVGGQIISFGTNSLTGNSNYLVAEVDESDKSIHKLSASYAIITNLETDHLDHYKDLNDIISTMKSFVDNIPQDGKIIICKDSDGNRELMKLLSDRNVITYGEEEESSDYVITDIEQTDSSSRFKILEKGKLLGEFFMPVAGKHYILNALSVIICSRLMGVSVENIKKGLENYKGVKRRFEKIAEKDGSIIIDDYAHHPTEIKATLSTANLFKRPVTVAFQPHRFSRTQGLMDDFSKSFEYADRVIITDIYGAGEKQEDFPETTSKKLSEMIKIHYPNKEVHYIASLEEISDFITKNKLEKEIIITMGAGTITNLSKMIFNEPQKVA
ncbi:MAG: UDP-N-acetylmuramate--L-alanine ligase [Candidatus Sericytochromatia bacterium]